MLTINIKKHEATVDGKEIVLPWREFQLARYLLEHKGYPVTREQVIVEAFGYPKKVVDEGYDTRTVDQHLARLRKKTGSKWVKTICNLGYKAIDGKLI